MDLSKLLDDLYEGDDSAAGTDEGAGGDDSGSSDATGDAEDHEPAMAGFGADAAPDWSDEARLDQVFASWTPGPPSDAPAAEREMAYAAAPAPSTPAAPSGLEPESAFPDAFPELSTSDEDGADPLSEQTWAEPAEARAWTRSDDDVLPHTRRRRTGARLSLRRR